MSAITGSEALVLDAGAMGGQAGCTGRSTGTTAQRKRPILTLIGPETAENASE